MLDAGQERCDWWTLSTSRVLASLQSTCNASSLQAVCQVDPTATSACCHIQWMTVGREQTQSPSVMPAGIGKQRKSSTLWQNRRYAS